MEGIHHAAHTRSCGAAARGLRAREARRARSGSIGTLSVCAILAGWVATSAAATQYDVGPGQPYASIGAVPWESLQAGDTVRIHWRAAPYAEKWVIAAQGTEAAPVLIQGVLGPNGERPVIEGGGAVTRLALDFWSEGRGVVKVGGSSNPPDLMPRHVTIENLEVRGARPPASFVDDAGATQAYPANAAAIYIEKGENVTIRNCVLHDCGNGLFVASSGTTVSRAILIEGNHIHSNGNLGSLYEHNTYTAAIGITYQFNRFGPPTPGADGNNLKDRSAGLVVRCNWIEGGNRQLDLVDAEDSALIRNDAAYGATYVYGNILIEPDGAGNRQLLHYGGDSGSTSWYRKGTLYLYNNTCVSTRTDRTTWMRLSTNDESCDARNNIVYVTLAGDTLAMLDATGVLDLSHNWFKPGWVGSHGTLLGTIHDDGTSVLGAAPGFVDEPGQDFHLTADSDCIDGSGALNAEVLPDYDVTSQYVEHQQSASRAVVGDGLEIGAFESVACPEDLNGDGVIDLKDLSTLLTNFGATGGVDPDDGDLDDDGDVDLDDLSRLLIRFGTACAG